MTAVIQHESPDCLLLQGGLHVDAFNTEEDVPWYLLTQHDTGATHHVQMMAATQNTLHVMLFVSHQRHVVSCLVNMVLVSDLAILQVCVNNLCQLNPPFNKGVPQAYVKIRTCGLAIGMC